MSRNVETVNTYLDGFRKNDHAQILDCLTDGIEWTVFGASTWSGKRHMTRRSMGRPSFSTRRGWRSCGWSSRGGRHGGDDRDGEAGRRGEMRMSMAEVFVMRDGKIAERRAWVVELKENDYR